MFALAIRFLCDWAMAKRPDSHERAEWPPHPDRVFMAFAAAHFETGGEHEHRRALEWLEALGPPQIYASGYEERAVVTSYVPVNDRADPVKKGRALTAMGAMPIGRDRQARQFPVAIPDDPVVHLIWPDAEAGVQHREALNSLCRYVTYVGHSSSLVQAWVTDSPRTPNRVPGARLTGEPLRVPYAGRLRDLEEQVADVGHPANYAWADYVTQSDSASGEDLCRTVFDDQILVLVKTQGQALGLESTLHLTEALRGAILAGCPEPVPEWVSGHESGGSPSQSPHIALIPLPHVGRKHADGHLLGVAIALPRGVNAAEQRRCLGEFLFSTGIVPRQIKLAFGRLGEWHVALENGDDIPQAMRRATWTRAATRWASVTPIVFDRHAKSKSTVTAAREAEQTIASACERIGLPRPTNIALSPVSVLVGSPHARRFPCLQRKAGGNRHHTHAILEFDQKVSGPVLIGAGRYRGYGLCRPLAEGGPQ